MTKHDKLNTEKKSKVMNQSFGDFFKYGSFLSMTYSTLLKYDGGLGGSTTYLNIRGYS